MPPKTATLALIGDLMLGRAVASALAEVPAAALVAPALVEVLQSADLVVANLECCISRRGTRWPAPGKPFFFRAPPAAVELLGLLHVGCVTLANNHALDYGPVALYDTLEQLAAANIATVGAGLDVARARRPVVVAAGGLRLAVVGVTDHPPDFDAGTDRPGVAFADLRLKVPGWLVATLRDAAAAGAVGGVLVSPHWGPNLVTAPVSHVRQAAATLAAAGATLIGGHSAHLPHGVALAGRVPVLYDLGDFLDDYQVDPQLRNDLGLLWLVSLDRAGPVRLEGIPLKLHCCHTGLADRADTTWIQRRFQAACAMLSTAVDVSQAGGRLVITWR